MVQDNVFVQLVCSIQYRVIKQNADDAFYELQNPREQIQSYVFDGKFHTFLLWKFDLNVFFLVPVHFGLCCSGSSYCPENDTG